MPDIIASRYLELSHARDEMALMSAAPNGNAYCFLLRSYGEFYTVVIRRDKGSWWVGTASRADGFQTAVKAREFVQSDSNDIFFRGYLWHEDDCNYQWAIELLTAPASDDA